MGLSHAGLNGEELKVGRKQAAEASDLWIVEQMGKRRICHHRDDDGKNDAMKTTEAA